MYIYIIFILYSSVDDIDIYAAGIAERPMPGGVVGPTFGCIIGRQFRNIRVGDRFWHERRDQVAGFTYGEVHSQSVQSVIILGASMLNHLTLTDILFINLIFMV